MELKSFREILIKKTEDNPRLQNLIKYVRDDVIISGVIESLEKMARLSRAAARNPNGPLLEFAGRMGDDDVHMLKDAIGHHISHYKNALERMHASEDDGEKSKFRTIADQHLSRIVPLAHLAARSEHHSKGRIAADLPPIRAWQANYTGHHKFKDYPAVDTNAEGKVRVYDPVRGAVTNYSDPNKEIIGTEGWGGRPSGSRKAGHDYNKSRSTPDWRYLEMPINSNHEESKSTTHKGAFPFEDIRVGSPSEIDSGGGHPHIEKVDPKIDSYVPHEFDQHPINNIFDVSDSKISDAQRVKFANDLDNWKDSEHYNNYIDRHDKLESSNPAEYKLRGAKKPGHLFEGIPLSKQPDHAVSTAMSTPEKTISTPSAVSKPVTAAQPIKTQPQPTEPSSLKPKAIITRKNR
jgi:hypothetical protein